MTRNPHRFVVLAACLLVVTAALIASLLSAGRGEAAAQAVPINVDPPVINGTPAIRETLTATTGTWTGTAPIAFTYVWQRCNATGGACVVVPGATSDSYPIEESDADSTLRVTVTARNADGMASATSVPTAVVLGVQVGTGCPPVQEAGPIPVTKIIPPARLLVDRKTISPAVVTRSTQTIRLRFHVVACDDREISGALVFATPTPYQQFSETETATGRDGWASVTMRRLRFFPVSDRQQLLIVFVRARKPGDRDLLGGISSRRLVSFRVKLG